MEKQQKSTKPPIVIDLFSGCGGMSWGLEKYGFKTVAAIDNWESALKTFSVNHPEARTYFGDIRELLPEKVMSDLKLIPGEVDLIVGGPPCQGFSKNVPAAYRFLDDERNQLFREYMRFVEYILPKAIVMENVAEIYNAYGGSVRDEIIHWLEKLGYNVDVRVVVASDFGVPQKRRRCLFFASRNGHQPQIPSHATGQSGVKIQSVSAWEAISDLPQIEDGEEFSGVNNIPANNEFQSWVRKDATQLHNHVSRKLRPLQKRRYESLLPGQAINDLPIEIRPKGGYSGAYGRLDFTSIAPTVTRWVFHPGSGRYGHPREIRSITMREAARLQSFTDDFVFVGSNTEIAGQIGNAVPPLLMYALGDEIMRCIQPS